MRKYKNIANALIKIKIKRSIISFILIYVVIKAYLFTFHLMLTLQTIEFVLLPVLDLLFDFHIVEYTFWIARFLCEAGRLFHELSQAPGLLGRLRLEVGARVLSLRL